MKLRDLTAFLDRELGLEGFSRDLSNNGLQIQGDEEVSSAVFGVDACQALFEEAARRNAGFVFVHHGLSWGSEPRRFTGITARRLELMFRNKISLYAAHLPLDAHPEFGNNAQLADMVGLRERLPFFEYDGKKIGFQGILKDDAPGGMISQYLAKKLDTEPVFYGDPERAVKKVAIVSGGGGLGALMDASACGCDLLITGEFDHTMYHPCQELGVGVAVLGHYASETVGPYALMKKVQAELGLDAEFVNIPTGL